jgi:hypothetical protein
MKQSAPAPNLPLILDLLIERFLQTPELKN